MEWLRVDFIFSREGLAEENGVISLNEHADSLEKVTTVKRDARVFRDLTPQLRDKRNRSLLSRHLSVIRITNRRRGGHVDLRVAVCVIKRFEFLFESVCSDVQVASDNVRR